MSSASPTRLRALVARFRGRRIGVLGDVMLDRFIRGRVSRVSPEAPVPVVEVNQPETAHPGGAGNVAANLAALGARPMVFGAVGRDAPGAELRRLLRKEGVNSDCLLALAGRVTTVKTRIIAEHQHVVRADWEERSGLAAAQEKKLLGRLRAALGRLDGLLVSDYDKGVLSESLLPRALELAAARSVPVFVDLKQPRALEPPPRLVVVNQARAEKMARVRIEDAKALALVGGQLLAYHGCACLIITRGARGMAVFERHARSHVVTVREIPTVAREVFDVTGAGDTVIAALALALASGASVWEAATLANHAAGVVVGKLGTAVCRREEMLASLADATRGPRPAARGS